MKIIKTFILVFVILINIKVSYALNNIVNTKIIVNDKVYENDMVINTGDKIKYIFNLDEKKIDDSFMLDTINTITLADKDGNIIDYYEKGFSLDTNNNYFEIDYTIPSINRVDASLNIKSISNNKDDNLLISPNISKSIKIRSDFIIPKVYIDSKTNTKIGLVITFLGVIALINANKKPKLLT